MKNRTLSLILGGGVGSRLYPLTKARSKPAVPIGGKYRLIDIPISNCLNSGFKKIYVLTQYNSASLNQHLKNTYHFDGFSNAYVDILAAEQTPNSKTWFQGTADAVRQSMHHLMQQDFEYVMILSGDQLYQMDFDEMLQNHIDSKADLSIATLPVTAKDATAFGILKVDDNNTITRFIEKPPMEFLPDWKSEVNDDCKLQNRHFLASMGIYIFSKNVLLNLFEEFPYATDFGKEIIPSAIERGLQVQSYAFDGYWTDIGSVRSFFDANMALTDDLPKFNLFDNYNIVYTRPRLLAPSKVFGTRLDAAVMAEGCIVHAKYIEKAVIGVRSRIGYNTTIENAIVMGNDYYESLDQILTTKDKNIMGIGDNCVIKNAMIDKNCRVGHNVSIVGDESLENTETATYCLVDGIVVVKKGVSIPDGAVIGLVEKQESKTRKDKVPQEFIEELTPGVVLDGFTLDKSLL